MLNAVILCVDDEPYNLSILRMALKDQYLLAFARSGLETLQAVEKHNPALILLDVQMPDMDGYEICRRLKGNDRTRHIPVIFVTSMDQEIDERAGFEAGAVDYITKPISVPIVQARVQTHLSLVKAEKLEKSYHDAIHMLGKAGDYNDTDTGVHIWRMAEYSRVLAEAVGWGCEQCNMLELAAPMHDTGKLGIPDAILKKPGKLNDAEWAIMKTHTTIGYGILTQSDAPLFQLAGQIALNHHEKWDGSGYPHGLSGNAIPESARIVALADVFDALSMKRPYKDPWPTDKIVSTLKESAGSHFEPRLVDKFMAVLPRILDIEAKWEA
ncbi:HD domain-containing phosphohydrolase [Methylomonas methanica]|uniref:Response regulator receiver modulated metal dependent phosphohydrolase n=1 Tax=Methylomonas methanica (strain DSM 25384 / MC09) TaxID=857087 RepID=G0A701_METMM|nr:HD domain-containing phosphohydrolase [Methylomonas methanica]AEG01795.1 response regulator receiver modulated metal dependent phosphohydrolase [Methylomonas methanica MC09]